MAEAPLVSVLMPAYNAEKTIAFALCSLLAQTYSNWECIVVNDGSTDSTLEELSRFNDSRIKVFSFEENKGRGEARKRSLELALGDYVTMLDADDWIYPEKLALQVDFMESHPNVALHSMGMAIGDSGIIVGIRAPSTSFGDYSKFHKLKIAHAPSMIRRSAIGCQNYDTRFKVAQDQDFLRRVLIGKRYALSSSIGYCYEEIQSVTPRKIVISYLYSSMGYLKLVPNFGFYPISAAVIEILKIFYIISKLMVGRGNSLVISRSSSPSIEEEEAYHKAYQVVSSFHKTLL